MKAAVVMGAGLEPVYADFCEPASAEGMELVKVSAAALTHLTKGRASGSHYSADGAFPAVAGTDGVGRTAEGRRVYFALPESPFGAMAEMSLVRRERCIDVPDGLDDVTAAALANPGMSVWAALMERAQFKAGETVLVNGATGTAGNLAVQIAKHLGAAKIIATGRNVAELENLKRLGADVVLPLKPGEAEAAAFDAVLQEQFAAGVDVVIDYLWGSSAMALIGAIARSGKEGRATRYVQVGSAGGTDTVALPSAALRSSSIVMMGSGLKSVSLPKLLECIAHVFAAAKPAHLQIETRAVALTEVGSTWGGGDGRPRLVYTMV